MTISKMKKIFIQGFLWNLFIFLIVLCGSRGVTQFFKDIGMIFAFIPDYFKGNYYPAKYLSLVFGILLILFLGVSIFFVCKKKKKRNLFGILLIFLVIYFTGISAVHTKEIGLVFDKACVPNKTLGVFIILFAIVSAVFLTAYAILLTKDLVEILNAERNAIKAEKARKLRQQERVNELKKQFAEAKEKRQQEASKYDDFEIETANSVKEKKEVVTEAKAEEVKEAEPVVEEKKEEKVEPVKEKSVVQEKEIVEEYALTEEGYLPLDDLKRPPLFDATFNDSGDTLKNLFSNLKNALLSYNLVGETRQKTMLLYKVNKVNVARVAFYKRGYKLYLALDPYTIDPNVYNQYDAFDKYQDTPLVVHIYDKASLEKAKDLIDEAFTIMEIVKNEEYVAADYTSLEVSTQEEKE